MGWESNKKAKQSDLYPKSVGEVASNENQVIQPFKWTRNADRSLVTVTCKNGYILDSSCIDGSSSGVSIGSVDFWAWSYDSIPEGFLAMLGQELSRTEYADLWAIAESNTGSDRYHFGIGNGSTTFTLPDWTGITIRGGVYVEVTSGNWDNTNNYLVLDYDNLPFGTPIVANETAGGLTAGTTYYLATDTSDDTHYRVYDTESNANAKGSTGRITLTAITGNVVLTGSGEYQGKTIWGHNHAPLSPYTAFWAGLVGGAAGAAGTGLSAAASTGGTISDGTHGTPELSNESRMANVQGIWIIKASGGSSSSSSTDLEARVVELENALAFDQPAKKGWTVVGAIAAGSSITFNHGKNTEYIDLDVKVAVRDPAVPDKHYKAVFYIYEAGLYGQNDNGVDLNNIKIQFGSGGGNSFRYVTDSGAWTTVPTTWEYNISVTAKRSINYINASSSTANPRFEVEDQKPAGTAGGTFSSGDWRTRDLNTIVYNTLPGASLASNQITLPKGTYIATIRCPALSVYQHRCRLQSITDTETILWGCNGWNDSNTLEAQTDSVILRRTFTMTKTTVLEIQHRCRTTSTDYGFGLDTNTYFTVDHETYTTASFEKIG